MTSTNCHAVGNARRWPAVALSCLGWLSAPLGCTNDNVGVVEGASVVGNVAAISGKGDHQEPIAWAACPQDFARECAWVALPVDHAEPKGDALPIFVSRFPALSGAASAQLWLLQGGPGGSGDIFRRLIENLLAPVMPDVDFYVLEHRGVGESARLGCAAFESPSSDNGESVTPDEWPACSESLQAQWMDELDHFTTTQDAEDLASLIGRTREPGKRVFVYGASYGTTRAMRFLQRYPDLVDGVILDSIVSPGVQYLSQFDDQFDPVAKALADLCAQDEICAQKLGDDPWARLTQLFDKLKAGHCPAFLHRSLVRQGFAQLLMSRDLRAHIFPLVYRLDRCAPQDLVVIERYFAAVSSQLSQSSAADRDSPALQIHVALSELWEQPAPSQAELEERCDAQVFCPEASVQIGARYPYWPRYAPDAYVGQWPSTDTPVLALNGTLDPQTPIEKARAAAPHFDAEHQHFITVPWSPHVVAISSPVNTPATPPCGTQLLRGFVDDPSAEPDTSCLDDLAPPFAFNPAVTAQFFGDADLWENAEPADPALAQSAASVSQSRVGLHPQAFAVWPLGLNWVPDL